MYSSYDGPPHFVFERESSLYSGGDTGTIGGELRVFVTVDGDRWRLRMRRVLARLKTTAQPMPVGHLWGDFDVDNWWGTSNPKDWGSIRGVAWKISNMVCHSGSVTRTALYIHSEMDDADLLDWDDPNQPENERWDGNNDYLSAGCIKVHPYDILQTWDWFAASIQKSSSYGEVVA